MNLQNNIFSVTCTRDKFNEWTVAMWWGLDIAVKESGYNKWSLCSVKVVPWFLCETIWFRNQYSWMNVIHFLKGITLNGCVLLNFNNVHVPPAYIRKTINFWCKILMCIVPLLQFPGQNWLCKTERLHANGPGHCTVLNPLVSKLLLLRFTETDTSSCPCPTGPATLPSVNFRDFRDEVPSRQSELSVSDKRVFSLLSNLL